MSGPEAAVAHELERAIARAEGVSALFPSEWNLLGGLLDAVSSGGDEERRRPLVVVRAVDGQQVEVEVSIGADGVVPAPATVRRVAELVDELLGRSELRATRIRVRAASIG